MKLLIFSIFYVLYHSWLGGVHAFSSLGLTNKILTRTTTNHVGSLFSTTSPSTPSTTTTDSSINQDDIETEITSKGLLKRDRYVATNRFSVRKGQQGKFEKRWATRKSSLAKLEGFQYFHLMRRVTPNEGDDNTNTYLEGETAEEAFENYVSFTIWNKKSHFSAWRTGEAFKEAHGGTSIGAFLSTMVSSAMVLRGAPRPAFYDGLLLDKTTPKTIPETVDGWRTVEADGINTLPAECFVVFEKIFVPSLHAKDFEQWQVTQKSNDNMANVDGFVASTLLRRDGQAKGHGIVEMQSNEPSYVKVQIFENRSSYSNWASSTNVQGTNDVYIANESWFARAPETVYFEGTLVISSPQGA